MNFGKTKITFKKFLSFYRVEDVFWFGLRFPKININDKVFIKNVEHRRIEFFYIQILIPKKKKLYEFMVDDVFYVNHKSHRRISQKKFDSILSKALCREVRTMMLSGRKVYLCEKAPEDLPETGIVWIKVG